MFEKGFQLEFGQYSRNSCLLFVSPASMSGYQTQAGQIRNGEPPEPLSGFGAFTNARQRFAWKLVTGRVTEWCRKVLSARDEDIEWELDGLTMDAEALAHAVRYYAAKQEVQDLRHLVRAIERCVRWDRGVPVGQGWVTMYRKPAHLASDTTPPAVEVG